MFYIISANKQCSTVYFKDLCWYVLCNTSSKKTSCCHLLQNLQSFSIWMFFGNRGILC